MLKFFKLFSPSVLVRRSTDVLRCFKGRERSFADAPTTTGAPSKEKQIAKNGPESEEKLRVRRARPSDVPRVLRFVRENARLAWPNLMPTATHNVSHLILCDYVARALAQGHTMLAEQHSARRGWLQIRGLALGTAVCAWDAALLERWARCLRCARSRRMLTFAAHCLNAPTLHDKYRVHNILQINLIVPEIQNYKEIINILTKSAMQRGRDVGFPLLRFDVTNEEIANTLEELKMKKEWQVAYNIVPDEMNEKEHLTIAKQQDAKNNFFAVYTTFTQTDKHPNITTVVPSNNVPPPVTQSEPTPIVPTTATARSCK